MNDLLAKRMPIVLLLTIALACVTSASGFDDWPQWRGPNRNDISSETGLLKTWPADGPEQLWVNQEAGLGYSGFAIVGDQLFTMGLEDNKEFALCLNAEDGTEIWRKTIGTKFRNAWGDGPRSTPSVDGENVYFMAASGELSCLQKADGKKIWSVKMSDFGGRVPNWGYSESPLVDGGKVVCTPGGKKGTMLALDKITGKKIWQSKPITKMLENGNQSGPAGAHYSSIVPVELNMRPIYVQLTVLAVVGVDAESGELIWQSDWPGRTAVIPSPIVDKGKVYITSGYGVGSKLVDVANEQAKDIWSSKVMQNHHGGVIQIGDYFYGSSSKSWVCQNKDDGELAWSDRAIRKGAVTYADGMFIHVEESGGRVLLIKADHESHSIISSFKISPQTKRRSSRGKIWVHPVVSDGKLYVRDQEIIHCYNLKEK